MSALLDFVQFSMSSLPLRQHPCQGGLGQRLAVAFRLGVEPFQAVEQAGRKRVAFQRRAVPHAAVGALDATAATGVAGGRIRRAALAYAAFELNL